MSFSGLQNFTFPFLLIVVPVGLVLKRVLCTRAFTSRFLAIFCTLSPHNDRPNRIIAVLYQESICCNMSSQRLCSQFLLFFIQSPALSRSTCEPCRIDLCLRRICQYLCKFWQNRCIISLLCSKKSINSG